MRHSRDSAKNVSTASNLCIAANLPRSHASRTRAAGDATHPTSHANLVARDLRNRVKNEVNHYVELQPHQSSIVHPE